MLHIVMGGQYGSEGKGKVTHHLVSKYRARATVRVGGPNSGHSVIESLGSNDGRLMPIKLRQLPVQCLFPYGTSVIAAGSYIDKDILLDEIATYKPHSLMIDPNAIIITDEAKRYEEERGIVQSIGSTGSGTGSGVIFRVYRDAFEERQRAGITFASEDPDLAQYIGDTKSYVRCELDQGAHVVLEGTQGSGLSLLHTTSYPYCTSRDTNAAGLLSELGLSPFDVETIHLVLRAYPIRVAGDSGPLPNETDWDTVTRLAHAKDPIREYTTVTGKLRRVGFFDSEVVKRAIMINRPTHIVMNHMDYIDYSSHDSITPSMTDAQRIWLEDVEFQIGRKINAIGNDARYLINLIDD